MIYIKDDTIFTKAISPETTGAHYGAFVVTYTKLPPVPAALARFFIDAYTKERPEEDTSITPVFRYSGRQWFYEEALPLWYQFYDEGHETFPTPEVLAKAKQWVELVPDEPCYIALSYRYGV